MSMVLSPHRPPTAQDEASSTDPRERRSPADVADLADGLGRLLDGLHAQLADEQLRTLERLRLRPADLLALGRLGAAPGARPDAEPETLDRLRARGLAEPSGRGETWLPTRAGRALLDELHEGRSRSIRRFVARLDRGRRLRLAGALHLLSGELDGVAVLDV